MSTSGHAWHNFAGNCKPNTYLSCSLNYILDHILFDLGAEAGHQNLSTCWNTRISFKRSPQSVQAEFDKKVKSVLRTMNKQATIRERANIVRLKR